MTAIEQPDDQDLRRGTAARTAIAVFFFMNGLLVGSWVPHIPLTKAELGVGPGVFGWLLLSAAAGAILAMPIAGLLIHRIGSAPVIRATALLFSLSFALPVLAFDPATLVVGLLVFGVGLGALDVAMNVHGLDVERLLRRPVMSSFHGWYSIGAAAGAGIGGAAIYVAGEAGHVILITASTLAMFWFASSRLLAAETDRGQPTSSFGLPTRATLGLGALAFLVLLIEGAILDWSALHLTQNVGTSVSFAGFGFAAFSVGMAVARFSGDILRHQFGSAPLVLASSIAVTLGLAVALSLDAPALAVAAFAVTGLGLGNIAPIMFAGGGRADRESPGRGVAAVSTMGYAGLMLGPPLIGMAAELVGLRLALGLTVVASLIVVFFWKAARAADG